MDDLISVIIPVYNVEKYLIRCMDSVLNQTYRRLEIILVDDGSTDSSGKICEEYQKKDARVKVLHQKNAGQSAARNAGIEMAAGAYIGFVDSDDSIAGDMYEYLYTLLQKNQADISMCSYTRKKRKLQLGRASEEVQEYKNQQIMEFFYRIHGEGTFYAVWNRLYKRELLQDISFIEKSRNEDVMYTYEVYKQAKKIVVSNLKKYFYYKNQQGLTRSRLCKKDFALIEIWDKIRCRERGTQDEIWAELNRSRAIYTLYVKGLIYGKEKDVSREHIRQWKAEIKGNYKNLMQGNFLDKKRKIILKCICK